MMRMKRLLLARQGLQTVIECNAWTLAFIGLMALTILIGLVASAIRSQTAFVALFFTLVFCAYLVWTIVPTLRNLDEMILRLVRLEIGGHGLIIDFEKSTGRAFLSGEVMVENATGCDIRLRHCHLERVGIDSPDAAPMKLARPESECNEVVPHDESRCIKVERNEIFGGTKGLEHAACVPINLAVSVRFEIEGENIVTPASRTLQCYALIRPASTEPPPLLME